MSFMAFTGGASASASGMANGSNSGSSSSSGVATTAAAPAAPPLELSSLLPEGWEQNGGLPARTLGTLLSNPYFSAGAGLWVLTVGGKLGTKAYAVAEALARRRFLVSMEMANTDSSYEWMMRWLSAKEQFRTQQMSVMTKAVRTYANDSAKTECYYTPCPGVRHWFFYKGRPISLMRRRTEQKSFEGGVFETLQFTTYGLSTTVFQSMMQEAQRMNDERDTDCTVVYLNGGGRWIRQSDPRPRRPFPSVVLPGALSETLLTDVKGFLGAGAYYRDRGVPYRRGYLLHGPPGCGKTSFVMALAGELRLSICLLSLSNRGLSDESLMALLNSAEMHSIVLMEDIDRAFTNDSTVTMSGLLNALDGVGAQEGRLVFMTTNHIERLDAALIRPGRADVKAEIGLLDREQAAKMFKKFFPDTPASLQEEFARRVRPNSVSVAQIQSHLFFHRESAQAAVDHLDEFLREADDFDSKLRERRKRDQKIRELPRPRMLHLDDPPTS